LPATVKSPRIKEILADMVERGWLTEEWDDSHQKSFRVTKRGRKAMRHLLATPEALHGGRLVDAALVSDANSL
jgi:DNA-binding PadR family transcriptional regulator